MSDYKLLLWPDPTLKQVSSNVRAAGVCDHVIRNMQDIMSKHRGVGLSAIQIGVPLRIVTSVFLPPVFNPVIVEKRGARERVREGCLSLPKFTEVVERYPIIVMDYFDEEFKPQTTLLTDLSAQCFQHELEHLDGLFFTDQLPRADRSRIRGEVMKFKRAGKWR